MELRLKLLRQRQCVEALAVRRMIIVGSFPNRRETCLAIHSDCGVAVANFEMDSRGAAFPGAVHEIVEQQLADALSMMARQDGNQEQLGFVGDRPSCS